MKTFKITLVLLAIVSLGYSQTPAIISQVIGKGTPILFLPGFTTPGSIFKETADRLTIENEAHFISYAGFNGIAAIPITDKTPWYNTIKEELVAYIKNNNLESVTIIGHSMGGNLATDLAAILPDTITNLIIIDAIPCMRELMMPGVPASTLHYESSYNIQMIAMEDAQFKQTATMMSQNMTNNKDKVETLINWILEADRKTYVYGYTDLLKLDLRPLLDKVTAKTLILGASFPTVEVAKSNYEKQYANLANKTISMASESKHFIMFDQPEWYYTQINDFLTHE